VVVFRSLRSCLVFASILCASVPAAAQEIDPFYSGLLRDGAYAYDRGEFAAATRDLRLACFGYLEQPVLLTGCLIRLGAAQAKAADADGFAETFRRVVELEEHFGGYRQAEVPAEVRAAFEERTAAAMPAATLAQVPVFAGLALGKIEAQLAALPVKQRRKELEARVQKEPQTALWHVLLAEVDLAEGQAAPALERARRAATLAPQDPRALCVRGLALARAERCAEAVADLQPCARSRRETPYAAALLGCWAAAGDWRGADELVRALPPEVARDRQIAGLAQRVQKGLAAARPPAGAKQTPASPRETTAPAKPTAAPAPQVPLAEGLERVRRLLATGVQDELREGLTLARELADANPGSREAQHLAGEAAYRSARWQDAASYFKRGGDPGDARPELLFYLAVALYESGERDAAASALERSLPNLERTPYVDAYAKRILRSRTSGGTGGR
jgi:predicted Zn-dependent protease